MHYTPYSPDRGVLTITECSNYECIASAIRICNSYYQRNGTTWVILHNISQRATNPCCTISWVITDFLYFSSGRNMRAFQPYFYRNYCIYPWAKYVAYATSLPVQHHLCCYCRVYLTYATSSINVIPTSQGMMFCPNNIHVV